ncbi:MAG TPA: Tim44/TimA family putative adaptor protein [Stellaceae bacterium]|jgi:predicted lipid-binding transport protein (Tim44 family)|nr:Tim44/TimA family putative adaptor protein [Stellaceae bacterium]
MGDFTHYADIILFAMIAAFLVLRLRSVLGRRTGNERRRDMFVREANPAHDKVVTLGQRRPPPAPIPPAPPLVDAPPASVEAGLARIRGADPGFDPAEFLEGVRGAFAIIVDAYATGDKDRLRPLLSDEVFSGFAAAIDERKSAGETMETRVVAVRHLDIAEAGVSGTSARVTVKLVTEQINVLRAHDGSVVDGDPDRPAEKTDFWSFTRDTRSGDPNWVLVATGSG